VVWPALAAARRREAGLRLPFIVDGCRAGSVPRAALGALAAWPQWLQISPEQVTLTAADRDAALAHMNAALRAQGWVRAWRDELFAITDPSTDPSTDTSTNTTTGRHLACTERAASRFWGTLTQGAHATGYVAGAEGQPTHLWVAQRALTKATDPGLHDNLVGGGVPLGQSPREALVREGWEEAGLTPAQMQPARAGRVLRLHRDVPEGLQVEDLHAFDLALPAGLVPQNQDGEVAGFTLLPVADALRLAASGAMTVDAELVTLDFALRHRLLPAAEAAPLAAALQPFWSPG
jgi:8-oxo-dGTP pyrophosphatase MutT (NUDIX family)